MSGDEHMNIGSLTITSLCMVSAFLSGCFAWNAIRVTNLKIRHRKKSLADADSISHSDILSSGTSSFDMKLLDRMILETNLRKLGSGTKESGRTRSSGNWFVENIKYSGLADQISYDGYRCVCKECSIVAGVVGALCGSIFSIELCLIAFILFFFIGARMPKAAINRRISLRTNEMERHLPEMLDVLSLGMRSGLSFDASIKLYTSHFKTLLSDEFFKAQKKWSSGLQNRDAALRDIAATYDSAIFGRVVEMMIRSIRFGSSMVEGLEAESAEARAVCKAKREEQVAKTPVKMMIPTGTLILPAMLILVLGPVLLELMGGGF